MPMGFVAAPAIAQGAHESVLYGAEGAESDETRALAPALDPASCRVTPYRLENLSLLLHTSETRSLPRVATKRSTANSTQNTDDWKKQVQTTETITHATHATHVTHATRATRATHAVFAIFVDAKTRFLKKICLFL